MLAVLERSSAIDHAQSLFARAFESRASDKIRAKVGYHGGHEDHTLFWSDGLGLWYCQRKIEGSRYWNAFGTEKPREASNASIVCEINFPLKGLNRSVGGVFARDDHGRVFVLHRGNIGGGRPGIGKTLFEEKYQGIRPDVIDGKEIASLAMIGDIESADLGRQVRCFVDTIKAMKYGIVTGALAGEKPSDEHEYNKEFAGKKRYLISGSIQASCNHGLIVEGLQKELEARGYKLANDRNRDLYVVDSHNNITALFEVKTGISTGDIHTALGQLYMNSVSLAKCKTLVLVTPELPPAIVRKRLSLLRIKCLTYRLSGEDVSFPGLSDLKL
jgi:hypothetical protein